jgi:hypothetical protein
MVVPAVPAPPIAKPKYPPGSIARFNVDRKVWSIYVPVGSTVAGLGIFDLNNHCLYGDCGLGQDDTEEPPPSGTTKGGEELEPKDPVTGRPLPQGGQERTKRPLYKKPLFWVVIVGGVAVVGTGGYFLLRRKAA